MNIMKRSVKVRTLCLLISAVVLGGAVTAAAIMGSPYDTLKKAALDAFTTRNATIETHGTLKINGVVLEEERSYIVQGDDRYLSYSISDSGDRDRFHFTTDSLNISAMPWLDDEDDWYSAGVRPVTGYPYNSYSSFGYNGFALFRPEERDSARMRFMELLLDLAVGDLKNNISMTSENGIRTIRGAFTDSQIPEVVKAGIDLLIEQSSSYYYNVNEISNSNNERVYDEIRINRGVKSVTTWKQPIRKMTATEQEAWDNGTFWDEYNKVQYSDTKVIDEDYSASEIHEFNLFDVVYLDDTYYIGITPPELVSQKDDLPISRDDFPYSSNPLFLPMNSFTVNSVRGEAKVDTSGDLIYLDITGVATIVDIFGEKQNVEVKYTVNITDIGTSSPVCPIPGAERFFTPENMKSLVGSENAYVYFKLNADGTIDTESVSTMHPHDTMSRWRYERSGDIIKDADDPDRPARIEDIDGGEGDGGVVEYPWDGGDSDEGDGD